MKKKKDEENFHIWEGIYKSFKDAPAKGPGFSGHTWNKRSLDNMALILKTAKEKKIVPEFVIYRENLLPIVTALIPKQNKKVLRIIDFGGNLGKEYISILGSSNIKRENIEYTVVENKEVCKLGNKLFKNDKQIKFLSNLPKAPEQVDIINIGSTLQYIENWQSLFKEFVAFNPSYIMFTDLQAGNIPTYVTVQNYYDSKMPVWYFNISDIISELKKEGFRLVHKSTFRGSFLGIEQDRPMQNLPKKFRLKNACNLLFQKN